MKAKAFALAMVLLVLGGLVSPSYGEEPPAIQSTPASRFSDFVPSSGELGLYLDGTWNVRLHVGASITQLRSTEIYLVNPTPTTLWAFVTLWGPNEEPLACRTAGITPNGTALFSPFSSLRPPTTDGRPVLYGAVKVLSTNTDGRPEIGLVGYTQGVVQNLDSGDVAALAESRLQPVPPQVLLHEVIVGIAGRPPKPIKVNELQKIKDLCEPVIIPRG